MQSVYSNTNESNLKHVCVWGSILQNKSKTEIQHSALVYKIMVCKMYWGLIISSVLFLVLFPSFYISPLLSNVVITYQCIQHICIVFHQGVTIFYLMYGTLFTLNNIKLFRFIERLYMFLKVITNEKWDVIPWYFPDRRKALFHYHCMAINVIQNKC